MEEPKLNIEDQQEKDLKNINIKGYSDNLMIANDSEKGYIMTQFIPESELPF